MKRCIVILLALLCMVAVCGLSLAEETTLSLSTVELYLKVGQKEALKTTVEPRASRKEGVTYQSSDEAVATVDKNGRVTAVAVGECQIAITSVASPETSITATVHVVVPVKKLTLSITADELRIGETATLTAELSPEDATVRDVTFSSSDDEIATVSAAGVVTAVSRGRATITARSADGFAKASARVTVRQQPTSLSLSPESLSVVVGKRVNEPKVSVLPKNAANKKVVWTIADENIATVDSRGRVTAVALGTTTLTATCVDAPEVSASIPVETVQLAQSLAFTQKEYSVIIGQTTQLSTLVTPDTASSKSVTYKVANRHIVTVDENGVVTALKGGKTTVTATTTDGSRKSAKTTIHVIVPVTGVSYKHHDVRVGAGGYGTFTATLEPSSATNKNMTWVSADESIATVTGTTNRFKVRGRQWGRTTITGTTEDGGFSVTVYVDVGSLRNAVTVRSVSIRNGKPYLVLQNRSDMNISQVRYVMRGLDGKFQSVDMSTRGDTSSLYGTYDHGLEPGQRTTHGSFSFQSPSNYSGMAILQFAITGWTTDTGYYDHNGNLCYSYNIANDRWQWVSSDNGQVVY